MLLLTIFPRSPSTCIAPWIYSCPIHCKSSWFWASLNIVTCRKFRPHSRKMSISVHWIRMSLGGTRGHFFTQWLQTTPTHLHLYSAKTWRHLCNCSPSSILVNHVQQACVTSKLPFFLWLCWQFANQVSYRFLCQGWHHPGLWLLKCYSGSNTVLVYLHQSQNVHLFSSTFTNWCLHIAYVSKVVPHSIGLGADLSSLAVSPQVTLVINLVVGCRYFPVGLWLLSQPKRSPPPWPVPNYTAWWQRHTGVSK